jgi:hypothetical protein
MSDGQNDQTLQKLQSAQSKLAEVQRELSFTSILEGVSRRVSNLANMQSGLPQLRNRGFVYQSELEGELSALSAQANQVLQQAQSESSQIANTMRPQFSSLDQRLRAAGTNKAEVYMVAHDVEMMADAFDQAKKRVEAIIKPFADRFDRAELAVKRATFTMDHFESSAFHLDPSEHPVLAISAIWEDAPQGKVKGVLYLSDHKVRFEHREEVVTKRTMLFFAAEKKEVKESLIEEPVGNLKASDDSERGMLMKDELITFTWEGATRKAPPKTRFELKDIKSKEFDTIVEALRRGELSSGRVASAGAPAGGGQIGQATKWPEKCASCGAALQAPVRGQTELNCEFCGKSHPLQVS